MYYRPWSTYQSCDKFRQLPNLSLSQFPQPQKMDNNRPYLIGSLGGVDKLTYIDNLEEKMRSTITAGLQEW